MMPIYDFECGSCSNVFEDLVRDTHVVPACPSCGSSVTSRVTSVLRRTTFVLKGSGWAADGYASPAGSNDQGGS